MSSGQPDLASVVQTADVRADRTPDGANVRLLLHTSARGREPSDRGGLTRRHIEIPHNSRFDGIAGSAGELWYVLGGLGRLIVAGHPDQLLGPDLGLWLPPTAQYRVSADEPAGLQLDAVSLPADVGPASATDPEPNQSGADLPIIRALHECEVETTGDRQFRVLFGPGRACEVATQFVGDIPPGRAPDHSHPYDEVVLVLRGEGLAHVAGTDHRVTAGTCLHLTPGQLHCMENIGTTTLRVLGVFHPADSPAVKLS